MVLESVVVCVDNSEWSRNGDFAPTRFDAQHDALNCISTNKIKQHHENTIGILTMAGERVEVRVSPTNDMGVLLAGMHLLNRSGVSDFVRSIQTAQLALKHRINKNQKQRVVCFVGSPMTTSEKQLVTLGKQLKKNNVALDIISFGHVEENKLKLTALHEAVNSGDTSHYLECISGEGKLLSDMVVSSRMLVDPDAPQGTEADATATSAALNEFGVDPNDDPELYMALRLSLEDEQNRARVAEGGAAGGDANANTVVVDGTNSSSSSAPSAANTSTNTNTTTNNNNTSSSSSSSESESAAPTTTAPDAQGFIPLTLDDIDGMSELDDELKETLKLSLAENVPDTSAATGDVKMEERTDSNSGSSSSTSADSSSTSDESKTKNQNGKNDDDKNKT